MKKNLLYAGIAVFLAVAMNAIIAACGWNTDFPTRNGWRSPLAPPPWVNGCAWVILFGLQGFAMGILDGIVKSDIKPYDVDRGRSHLSAHAKTQLWALMGLCILFPILYFVGGDSSGFGYYWFRYRLWQNSDYRGAVLCLIAIGLAASTIAATWHIKREISLLVLPTLIWTVYMQIVIQTVVWHKVSVTFGNP